MKTKKFTHPDFLAANEYFTSQHLVRIPPPQDVVDESNYGFVNIIAKHINEDTESIYDKVRNEYGLIAEENPVALYNHKRLYKSI